MATESDWRGLVDEIEIGDSAVEQIDDEITVAIAGVVGVHFQVTSEQALKISNALTAAAKNASEFLSAGT